jgi:hypothetical protein
MAALAARSSFFFSRSAAFCAREAAGTGLSDGAAVEGRARGRCAVAGFGGSGVAAVVAAAARSTCLLSLVLGLLCRDLAIELAHWSLNGLGLGCLRLLLRLAILGLGLLSKLGRLGLQVGEVQLLHLRELRRNTGRCAVRTACGARRVAAAA